jgi:hypothetical protein
MGGSVSYILGGMVGFSFDFGQYRGLFDTGAGLEFRCMPSKGFGAFMPF